MRTTTGVAGVSSASVSLTTFSRRYAGSPSNQALTPDHGNDRALPMSKGWQSSGGPANAGVACESTNRPAAAVKIQDVSADRNLRVMSASCTEDDGRRRALTE